jgi:hypothetical protein
VHATASGCDEQSSSCVQATQWLELDVDGVGDEHAAMTATRAHEPNRTFMILLLLFPEEQDAALSENR